MPLAAFQNESRLATERESEFRVSQSVRVSVRVSDSVCVREREITADSTYKMFHLQKLSSGLEPGRNQASSSIPPITEQAEFRKNRVLHKYY